MEEFNSPPIDWSAGYTLRPYPTFDQRLLDITLRLFFTQHILSPTRVRKGQQPNCLSEREKATWRHPRSRQWHLLDYVLVRRRGQRDVLVTKEIAGADGWTDHRLVISKMRIRLQARRRPQGKRPPGKLNVALLSLPAHHLHFSNELAQRLDNLPIAAAADAPDVQERMRILSIYPMLRQMQLRWSGHLARMDDERPPKRLSYGDIVTAGSRRQGGQICRYKNTLKSSLKRLQINPANWGDLARD
nr:unnamed protein product [Spirometra erinaceieuropaei]